MSELTDKTEAMLLAAVEQQQKDIDRGAPLSTANVKTLTEAVVTFLGIHRRKPPVAGA